jgi:hypothetical protein
MTVTTLRALTQVQAQREQRAQRELHAAAQATREAEQQLAQAERKQREIEDDIAATLRWPFRNGAGITVRMADIQASRRRTELLAQHLEQARVDVQTRRAALDECRRREALALREYLRMHNKHEQAVDRLGQARRAERAGSDRRQLEAAQELKQARAQSRPIASHR